MLLTMPLSDSGSPVASYDLQGMSRSICLSPKALCDLTVQSSPYFLLLFPTSESSLSDGTGIGVASLALLSLLYIECLPSPNPN